MADAGLGGRAPDRCGEGVIEAHDGKAEQREGDERQRVAEEGNGQDERQQDGVVRSVEVDVALEAGGPPARGSRRRELGEELFGGPRGHGPFHLQQPPTPRSLSPCRAHAKARRRLPRRTRRQTPGQALVGNKSRSLGVSLIPVSSGGRGGDVRFELGSNQERKH